MARGASASEDDRFASAVDGLLGTSVECETEVDRPVPCQRASIEEPPESIEETRERWRRYAAFRDRLRSHELVYDQFLEVAGGRRLPLSVKRRWGDAVEILERCEFDEIPRVARHPDPGFRHQIAVHPRLPDAVIEELANDQWCEVRAAVVTNPMVPHETLEMLLEDDVPGVAIMARLRLDSSPHQPDLLAGLIRCVECGDRIKNRRFVTCSISCSLDLAARHSEIDHLYVDVIDADRRHSTGLRDDWPLGWIRDVTSAKPSGGVPHTGPRYRRKLVSFVWGVTAQEIVDFARGVRSSGRSQRAALRRLAGDTAEEIESL